MSLIPKVFDFAQVAKFVLHGDATGLELYGLQVEPRSTDDEMILLDNAHQFIMEKNQAEVNQYDSLAAQDSTDAEILKAQAEQKEQSIEGNAVSDS